MNERKIFGNQGSPEQIDATEKNMHNLELAASAVREQYLKQWKEIGLNGEVYVDYNEPEHDGNRMTGNINGHKFKISYWIDNSKFGRTSGNIDGKELSSEQANEIYFAHLKHAMPLKDEWAATDLINRRLNSQEFEEKRQREWAAKEEKDKEVQELVSDLLK